MSKKNKDDKEFRRPDNLVQFPGTPLPTEAEALDMQAGMPEFLEFYLPRALEFAYLTAEETMRLLEELLGTDVEQDQRLFEVDTRPEMEKLRQDPRSVCEALDVILVKLQGLALIIPPPEILVPLLPEMEDVDGFLDLHEVTETCAEVISEIISQIVEETGPVLWASEPAVLKSRTVRAKKTKQALNNVHEMMDAVSVALDEALELFYEIADE